MFMGCVRQFMNVLQERFLRRQRREPWGKSWKCLPKWKSQWKEDWKRSWNRGLGCIRKSATLPWKTCGRRQKKRLSLKRRNGCRAGWRWFVRRREFFACWRLLGFISICIRNFTASGESLQKPCFSGHRMT